MFPIKLAHLIETHADNLSDGLIHKLKNSERCSELLQNVTPDELKRRSYEIYRNLSEWLQTKTEWEIEERYTGLGMRRAKQEVPFSQFLWAISLTKEYLYDYLRREGLLEEPVDFFGELELLQSLEHFFDRAIYYAAMGYEMAHPAEARQSFVAQAVGQGRRSLR